MTYERLTEKLVQLRQADGIVDELSTNPMKRSVEALPIQMQLEQLKPDAPLQFRGDGSRDIQQVAASGIQGSSGTLPHVAQIQRSFGRHDMAGVNAYVGGSAEQANAQMGSDAYATGNNVAFKKTPDLHTAAHEAAHVVQQRGGVSLEGGVGQVGDKYEQHADAVADAVVQGKSAEALLDPFAGSPNAMAPGVAPVQQKLPSRETFVSGSSLSRMQSLSQSRSVELQNIDQLLEEWVTANKIYPRAKKIQVLDKILNAISTWKACGRTNRLAHVKALEAEVIAEKNTLTRLEEERSGVIATITEDAELEEGDSKAAKASKLFRAFMRWGRANCTYRCTGGDVLNGKLGACGSFAKAFLEVCRSNGLKGKPKVYNHVKFITPELGNTFVDASCKGNLTDTNSVDDVGNVKRFFFSEHHVCEVEGQEFDPTAGVVGAMVPLVANLAQDQSANYKYSGGDYTVEKVGVGPTGGVYKLTQS